MKLDAFNLFNFETNKKIQDELISNGFEITSNNCQIKKYEIEFEAIYKNISFTLTIGRNTKNIPTMNYSIDKTKYKIDEKNNEFDLEIDLIKERITKISDILIETERKKQQEESDKRAVTFKLGLIQSYVEADILKIFNSGWKCEKSDDGRMVMTLVLNIIKKDNVYISLLPPRSRDSFISTDIDLLNWNVEYKNRSKKYSYQDLLKFLHLLKGHMNVFSSKMLEIKNLNKENAEMEKKLAENKKNVRIIENELLSKTESSIIGCLLTKINQENIVLISKNDEDDDEDEFLHD